MNHTRNQEVKAVKENHNGVSGDLEDHKKPIKGMGADESQAVLQTRVTFMKLLEQEGD